MGGTSWPWTPHICWSQDWWVPTAGIWLSNRQERHDLGEHPGCVENPPFLGWFYLGKSTVHAGFAYKNMVIWSANSLVWLSECKTSIAKNEIVTLGFEEWLIWNCREACARSPKLLMIYQERSFVGAPRIYRGHQPQVVTGQFNCLAKGSHCKPCELTTRMPLMNSRVVVK